VKSATPMKAKPSRTTPASQGWLNAAKPPAAANAVAAAITRPRAVANSPSASE
jgi:hypothetical protein